MEKRALLVGINTYPDAPLRGCVNDVMAMRDVLKEQYGFTDITMLTDNAATTANIRNALDNLVTGLQPGDIVYFHYSGHGSQVLDSTSDADNEIDGLDEIICPVDLNWRDKMITDDELKSIFDRVPSGVNLTVTLDCCNSGGGLDQDNQYQPLGEARIAAIEEAVEEKGGRYLPPPAHALMERVERDIGFKPKAISRNVNSTGLLVTGCQSHQTSADAYIGGQYMGACTYFLIDSLKNNPEIGYKSLVDEMNQNLAYYGFTQRPELNGPASLFDKSYLQPYADADLTEIPTIEPGIDIGLEAPVIDEPAPVVINEEAPAEEKPNKKTKIAVIIGAIIIIGLILAAV